MAEAKPVIFDIGARGMGAFFTHYSKKLKGLPLKVAKDIEKRAKENIEKGFTQEGRFEELSRFTMLTKTRQRTSPLRRTGALADSIQAEQLTSDFAVVRVHASYGDIHEFGRLFEVSKGTIQGEKVRDFFLAKFLETKGVTKPLAGVTTVLRIPERPFFRPAFDATIADLPRLLRREFPDAPALGIRVEVIGT